MNLRKALLALAVIGLFAAPARAQNVVIKMATLVPDGSSWHLVLKEMADAWSKASGGRVTVRLYPGGVAGDDPDVVRKMRLGTLNAGVLTSVGIGEIDKSVYALGVPMMYASDEEVYAVLEKMRPRLEASLDQKGFVVLNWADGGWVHFFSQKPVATPDDLRAMKLFTWQGDNDALEIYRSIGMNPVPLPSTEISTALQTGLVSALGVPPQVAVISQYFLNAKNMTDMKWLLLLGGTVVSKSTWEKIPAEVRPALRQAAEDAGKKLREQMRGSAERDVESMKKRGLTVVPVDARARAAWLALAESVYPKVRGKIVPADAFDEAMRQRDAYRKAGSH